MSSSNTPKHGATAPSSPSPESSVMPTTQGGEAAPSPSSDKLDFSPAPGAAPSESVPQSQPMTATASNSSEHPAADNNNHNNDTNSAAPYGTRSRNRPSGSRPNYADDKELDLEIEAAGKLSKTSKKAAAAAPSQQKSPSTEPDANMRIDGSHTVVNGGAQITNGITTAPGSGHYDVLPPSQPASKKRKTPGSNTTVSAAATVSAKTKSAAASQSRSFTETNMMTFERCGYRLNTKKQLVADDGTVLERNSHAYFICEPPGEPYYLARIMDFLHQNNDSNAPVDALRVNWYYRPKDIQRRVQDTRVVFASMHSDQCPLTSIRGKCNIQHLSSIPNLDEYRIQKDCFWFDKLYDRYMHRYYEVVPTDKVVNVPPHVKKVLDERWKFVLVEVGRGRDLTSASKMCKRCGDFAANHNSVDCAVCKNTYHMACVRPPLLKKPARGFAWACAACSRAQELRMEARNTPTASDSAAAADDDLMDDEDDDLASRDQATRESSVGAEAHPPPTAAQLVQAELWPYRYLGIHSRPEDALDYDDRIYPRASSRLGPRHQANVNVWHGRPVELVKPAEGKKKYKSATGNKKDVKSVTDLDKDKRQKRPKWVIDEPPGYVARGQDEPVDVKGKKEHTAQLTFRMPDPSKFTGRGDDDNDDDQQRTARNEKIIDDYMKRVKPLAAQYGVLEVSTDFLTKAVEKLQESSYDIDKAMESMKHLSLRGDLKQPDLNREEVKRFEEGVAKFGSELHLVARHVSPNIKESRIVRFYYMWKKTDRGRQIWGTYEGRRSKKESRRVEKDGNTKLLDDVADDHDDSAFDNDKALQKKRGFVCKFCEARSSRQWRRAPGTAPGTLIPADAASKNSKDKSGWLTLALCGKCAYLWRRYAIQYESIEEVGKKIAAAGGRASKRRVDEELMRTVIEAQCEAGDTITRNVAQIASSAGVEVPAVMVQSDEPPKKKAKAEKDGHAATPEVVPEKKKAAAPSAPPEPEPLELEQPRVKVHPCAVCHVIDVPQDRLLKCRDCRLHVHGRCYGVAPETHTNPWFCDMCRNDHTTQVSTTYECVLCPVVCTPQDLMEPPKVTHKKKTDREREKERLEREMMQEAGKRWRQDQEAAGRPVNPREALKRTAWNNWIHVVCALWTKEIKFGNAELLDAAEGVGFIPFEKYHQPCKLCKVPNLPTVNCHYANCATTFHIGCAHQAGYHFGFDVAPVKGSRRDSVAVMKLDQEVGAVTPAIWCPAHPNIPTMVHEMLEMTPQGLTAMQEFARTYKQVDTTITGTVRRAAQFTSQMPPLVATAQSSNRRASAINGASSQTQNERTLRSSPSPISPIAVDGEGTSLRKNRRADAPKKCCSCLVETSPKWWPIRTPHRGGDVSMVNGVSDQTNGMPAAIPGSRMAVPMNGFVKSEPAELSATDIPAAQEELRYQCHKCHVEKKTPPSSPSQVRPREKPRPEPVQEPVILHQPFPPAQPGLYAPARPAYETPTHAHPTANGVIGHPSPWPSGPPPPPPPGPWPAPNIRNNSHPPPPTGVVYATPPPPPPPPRSGLPPPPDYSSPYGRPPYTPYNTVPPPPPPPSHSRPPANGVPHHSPPPVPYGQALHPPSPRVYASPADRPSATSPQVGLGSSSILARPFAPPEPGRPRATDSPASSYSRPHQPPLPPPPTGLPRPPSSQNLAQIGQTVSEQSTHPSTSAHSRHASVDAHGTPRLGLRASTLGESPSQRPVTPADTAVAQVGNGSESRKSVGASASPRIKNLMD